MTETEQLALFTAFLAAVVVAGLSLSLVPHVELVTLVVFSAGIVLGAGRGAVIGAVGMTLYVFANSAARGFPPSPFPLLGAQALGMALPGAAGGVWRRWWLAGGRPRRTALLALPVIGFTLAALFQAMTNLVFAFLLTEAGSARWPVFWSGMAFGLIDMIVNALVFAVAGPALASQLRRLARSRGWWARAAMAAAIVACLAPRVVEGADAAADSTAAHVDSTIAQVDSAAAPVDSAAAHVDSTIAQADSAAAPVDTSRVRGVPVRPLRPLVLVPETLWSPYPGGSAAVVGLPGALGGIGGAESEGSRVTTPASPIALDRWALGWNRVRLSYDGVPLNGPVHSFADPPDLPLAWRGIWKKRESASGTAIDLGAPPPAEGDPVSQISLTSGSLGRRSDEFALYRNLGPVDVSVDFRDREELGLVDLDEVTANRVWFRVNSRTGRRPDWSLDLSMGSDKAVAFTGATLKRSARRAQASLRGPFLGGETRFALQARRQALGVRGGPSDNGEVIFDGFTLQADWAAPGLSGLTARARWDRDRRRRLLETDRTFDGLTAGLLWSGGWRAWRASAEAMGGRQEPWGGMATGAAALAWEMGPWQARVVASHEEDLPAMVLGVDRAILEYGLREHLEHFETVEDPESRSAIRAEGTWTRGRLGMTIGGWKARVRHQRLDANPLWIAVVSPYAPGIAPPDAADVLGAYGSLRVDLGRGVFVVGEGRTHDRPLSEAPYLASWQGEGSLHWRRKWFKDSLDLDASVGGRALGPRGNPGGERYVTTALGYAQAVARIENGTLTLAFQNLSDSYMESDLRSSDTVTPLAVPGRTFLLGLTMYLTQ
jgi:hypothetical protein